MLFKGERVLWCAEVEKIASLMANKSAEEIEEILEQYDVVSIKAIDRPKESALRRLVKALLFIPVHLGAFLLMGVKWLITGDQYLDSWIKRSRLLSMALDLYD